MEGVFKSWMGKRAVDYRRQFNITPDLANGTAVNICTMVFGNMGNDSATGVGFTRDPGNGENVLYGDYLINAQGEDVVAGIRTPRPLKELRTDMPAIYRELEKLRSTLEKHYREVQDFEFTIERGKLYMLQTRNGKMNAWALVKTSVDMVQGRPDFRRGGPASDRAGHAGAVPPPPHRPGFQASSPWPWASPPRPARPSARWCSTPTGPSAWAM